MTSVSPSVARALPARRAPIRSIISRSIAVAGIAFFIGSSAQASIIYSNLTPGGGYDTASGLVVGSLSELSQAAEFTNATGSEVTVTQIDLGLTSSFGTNSAIVSLWSSNGTGLGSELASWTIDNQPDTTSNALTSITDISGLRLSAGGSYFLQVGPGASDTLDIWGLNKTGASTLIISTSAAGGALNNPGLAPAFEVQGVVPAVPLPASAWLMLTGLVALAWLHKRTNNKAIRRC